MGQRTLSRGTTPLARAALFSGALTLVAGLLVWGLASGPTPASAAASACTTANLDVWLNTNGNGAAGSSYYRPQSHEPLGGGVHAVRLPRHLRRHPSGYPSSAAPARAADARAVPTVITLTSARSAKRLE